MTGHNWAFVSLAFFLVIKRVSPQAINITCPLADIAFLIDSSANMGQTNFNKIQTVLRNFVNSPTLTFGSIDVGIALVRYPPSSTDILFSYFLIKPEITTAVARLSYDGGRSDLPTALRTVSSIVFTSLTADRPEAPNILVVISGGKSDLNFALLQTAVNTLVNTTVIAISLSNSTDPGVLQELQILTSNNANNIHRVNDTSTMLNILGNSLPRMCAPAAQAGACSGDKVDVCLIYDTSSSITYVDVNNWQLMINFGQGIIEAHDIIGPNGTLFALIMFSDNATVQFYLNNYTDASSLIYAMDRQVYRGGETDIAAALRLARTVIFTPANGDRLDIPNVIILITDGQSNVEAFNTQSEASQTRLAGIEIFAIGVTSDIDVNELNGIVTQPNKTHLYTLADFNALESIRAEVVASVCRTTTTSTTTTTTTTTTTPTTTTTTSTTTTTPTTTTTTPTTTTTTPTTTTTTPTTTTTTPTTTTTTPTTTTTTPTTTTTTPTTTTTTPTTTTTTPTTTTTTPTTTTTTSTTASIPVSASTTRKPIERCDGSADVVFVLDQSGSIEQNNFAAVKQFLELVVDQLDVERGKIRVGLMTFADYPSMAFPLGAHTNRGAVINAIDALTYSAGTTNTGMAMTFLRTVMFNATYNSPAPDVAIVITDGDSGNQTYTLRVSMLAREAGIHIITLGIGDWCNAFELRSMSSYPHNQNDIRVPSYSVLNQWVRTFRDIICNNNNQCLNSSFSCANGGQCQNEMSFSYCTCPTTYAGLRCQLPCSKAADVVILVDGSGSLGTQNFQFLRDFVKNLTFQLDIDSSASATQGVRVALGTFSDVFVDEFNLNDHLTKMSVLNAISVAYAGGTTNMADALSQTCSPGGMFDVTRGGRPGVRKYILLFTDGKSNNASATRSAAQLCHSYGYLVIVVGLTYSTAADELAAVANYPASSNVFFFVQFSDMAAAQDALATNISALLCDNNDPCLQSLCQNGATCVSMLSDYQCRCTAGWYGFYCNETCREELDLVFLLDVSGSIRKERWPLIQNFVVNIIRQFNFDGLNRTRVAVVYFDDNPHVAYYFNTYSYMQGLIQGVLDIPFTGGKTNTYGAFELLLNSVFTQANGDRLIVRNFIVMITDGASNINTELTLQAATNVRETGAKIMVVPIGGNFADMLEINAIASLPLDKFVQKTPTFSGLPKILPSILTATCNSMNECSPPNLSEPCQNQGTCIDDFLSYYCDCSNGRTGVNCEIVCNIGNKDIVLLLDLSGSTEDEFNLMTYFAYNFTYGLDMTNDRTRLGVIVFNTKPQILFKLNTYTDKLSVLNALRFEYVGGWTDIYAALQLVLTDVFTPAGGDRPGVPNVLVLVTDGYDTVGSGDPVSAAQNLKSQGVEIYTVTMMQNPNLAVINAISTDPDATHVQPIGPPEAAIASSNLLGQVCN